MEISNFYLIFLIFLFTFFGMCVIISTSLSIYTFISIKAIEKSTHKLEYVPFDPNWANADQKSQASVKGEGRVSSPLGEKYEDDDTNYDNLF